MRTAVSIILVFTLAALPLAAEREQKLTEQERLALIRGLTAELAKAKVQLPRSKKPLPFSSDGTYDKKRWLEAETEFGTAAKVGDVVQITKLAFEEEELILEINGGLKSGRKWYDGVSAGTGSTMTNAGANRQRVASLGTAIALTFSKKIIALDTAQVKKLLAPILSFELKSVTEDYMTTLPEPIQKAIKEKRVLVGMDRDQVILAVGRPTRKERRSVDGDELEEWIFGRAPGKITFVTFQSGKVTVVKDSYAGLGGSTAAELPVQ